MCGADRDGTHPSGSSLWMKSLHRDRMAKLMTRCFSRVSDDWRQQDSQRVMEILERLVYRSVDTDLLSTNFSTCSWSITPTSGESFRMLFRKTAPLTSSMKTVI